MDETAEQNNSSNYAWLRPWHFKPGQSGNPSGKAKGTVSLKKFAQKYIQELTDEEKLEFLAGIDKDKVWEMAEGKAKQDIELEGEITSKVVKLDIE